MKYLHILRTRLWIHNMANNKTSGTRCYYSTEKKIGNSTDLKGILVAVPTPFRNTKSQDVDYDMLRFNVRKWEKIPLKGYCIGGTNGEWPYLKDEEKLSLIRTVKAEVNDGNRIILAGTTCESTERTVELSRAAADAGANAVLIMTPYYFRTKMTEKLMVDHFARIADNVPVPVVIYNMPPITGIDISITAIKILATHSNIIGIKDSDVTKIACVVQETPNDNFKVFAGSAGYLLPALQMGSSGGINGLAAILGQEIHALYSLTTNGDWKKAIEMQKRLAFIDFLIMRNLGPVGLKAAMDIMGYQGGLCRKPLGPLEEKLKTEIKNALKQQAFL